MSKEFPVHVYADRKPGQTAEEIVREQVQLADKLSQAVRSLGHDVPVTPDDITIGTNDDPDCEPWILG